MENKVVTLKINSDFGSAEADLKSLGIAVKNVDKEVTNLDATFEEIYGDLKPLTARMGEAEDRLYELSLAGKQNTKEFKELLKAVGNYRQVQIQTDLVVDAAATKLFPKLTQSLNAVAGGFSVAQGAIGLFGNESESVEKAMLKVQSAMAISQGFESINQSKNSIAQLGLTLKNTSVVQKTMTAATAAYTFVTQASTTGLKLFRGALIGTGIGAIVVGLGLLIANFDKVKQTIMSVIPGLSSVGKVIGGIVDSITDFVGATSDASRALDKLKKDADNTLSVNKKFMSEHSDQLDEYTKKKIEAKNAYSEAIKEDGANQNELAKKLNRELAAIEFSRGDEKRKIQKAANEKAKADRKTANEKTIKDAEDEAKRLKEEKDKAIISEAEVFRNQLEAVQKVEADAKKANADALLTEQQLAIQTENEAYEIKKANAIKFGEGIAEIETQHLNTLNDINLTAQNKQYEDDKIASDKKKAAADEEIENTKRKYQAMSLIAQNGQAFITAIQNAGLAKGKAGQAAMKALTLIQIGIDTAQAFSTAVPMAIKAGSEAAKLAGPAAPIVGPLATAASYLSSATMIASNIAKAKQLLSSGGSGGGASTSGSAPSSIGGGGAPTAPSFNVVGASSTNQLAQTIGSQQQQPIQAYVVANNVTTAQALDRNIIQSASIG